MTNALKAQELFALAADTARTQAERRAAWNELNALKQKSKTSFEKLGVPTDERTRVATELLMGDEPFEASEAELKAQTLRPVADPLDEKLATEVVETAVINPPAAPKLAPVKLADAEKVVKKAKEKAETDRGKISAEVKRLLTDTELPYSEIVEAVCKAFPKAVTTTRSVASVASEMRAKGLTVKTRRVAAKVKA